MDNVIKCRQFTICISEIYKPILNRVILGLWYTKIKDYKDYLEGNVYMIKMTCSVCGMKVNEKNCNFNKEAFINLNSEEKMMHCPFCGAAIEYLIEDGEKIKYDRNKLDQNNLKIIDHAVKLEVFNGDFYKKASSMAKDENIKSMFKDLSAIEYMHARIHMGIAGIKEIPILKEMDYSRYDTDEALLDAACQREKHAVEYYKKYKKEINEKNIIKIFDILSRVEKEHIELTKENGLNKLLKGKRKEKFLFSSYF